MTTTIANTSTTATTKTGTTIETTTITNEQESGITMRRTTTCLSFQKPVYETVCLVSWSQFSDFLYDSSMVSRTMEIRIQLVVERYVDFYSRRFYPGHAGLQFLFFYPPIRGMNGWMDENGAGLVSNVSASLKDDSSVLGERKKRTFVGESRSLERRRLIGSELIWRFFDRSGINCSFFESQSSRMDREESWNVRKSERETRSNCSRQRYRSIRSNVANEKQEFEMFVITRGRKKGA